MSLRFGYAVRRLAWRGYIFVVAPLVAIPVSAWLDDEVVGPGLLLGGVLVLMGVYLGALRGRWRGRGHRRVGPSITER